MAALSFTLRQYLPSPVSGRSCWRWYRCSQETLDLLRWSFLGSVLAGAFLSHKMLRSLVDEAVRVYLHVEDLKFSSSVLNQKICLKDILPRSLQAAKL